MIGDSCIARYVAASLVFGSLCFGGAALADDVEVIDPNNRPAFLLVSVSQTFDVPNLAELLKEEVRPKGGSRRSR